MYPSKKDPSLLQSFIPLTVLVALLAVNVLKVYADDALSGANQLALLLSASIAFVIAIGLGNKWSNLLDGVVQSISSTIPAIIILLLIGSLSGTWLISGVIPAMIYYGLDLFHPTLFLFACCLICSLVSLATGSSWSTVATVGIAFLGIGKILLIPESMVAGAIISGAYFGDKMSPLSDTTNLAPAIAGTDLFTHIKYMTYTTVPSISITLVLFLVLGLSYSDPIKITTITHIQKALLSKFNITPWLFMIPFITFLMIWRKVPTIPVLLISSLLGGILSIFFQPTLIQTMSDQTNPFLASYETIVTAMSTNIAILTSNDTVNELLNSGGMAGMLNTVWLIICAMIFGGIMEKSGMLEKITSSILAFSKSVKSLIATTVAACVSVNIVTADQYLSIILPGKMFAKQYKNQGLDAKVLSRTLEDSGTVTSPLIPWNSCGAYHSGILGVATGDYFMYCFFNLLSPLMTLFVGIFKVKPGKT